MTTDIFHALLTSDINTLSQPGMVSGILCVMFVFIFAESAFLPAAFIPGDSLLLLAGVLSRQNILSFWPTFLILVTATGTGYWVNYLLGRWLGSTRPVKRWIAAVPEHYELRTKTLIERYGILALLAGRFIGFVRTLLPLMAGMSRVRQTSFQVFSWAGAFIWIYSMMSAGSALTNVAVFQHNQTAGMGLLLILPVVLFIAGIAGSLLIAYRRRKVVKR